MRMQWGAISLDSRIQRVHKVWNPKDNELEDELMAKLKATKQLLRDKIEKHRQQCSHVGTPEYDLLNDQNNAIRRYNAALPRGIRKGRRNRMTLARLYPFERIERNHKKGGINFV